MTESPNKPGWPITVGAIAFFVAFNFLAIAKYSVNAKDVMVGFYFLCVGLLFLLAYYYESRAFVFRWLIWLCEHFSSPANRKMAFFYAGLCGLLGTIAILQGFGIINVARHG